MFMNKPFSSRSMRVTVFQIASETAAAELPDYHTRFAFGSDAVGGLWTAS
ncbi:hypothetical protein GHK33_21380 [Sinorhizobium meliloti]|nr:hypothetical protein [Sinorhizobium meliloti]MQW65085.1 hypothetical protein [Sinorhizobium meliloti]